MNIESDTDIQTPPTAKQRPAWLARKVAAPLWAMIAAALLLVSLASGVTCFLAATDHEYDFGPQAVPSASFLRTDVTTMGNWKGVYGSVGFILANDASDLPRNVLVSGPTKDKPVTWADGVEDARALQKVRAGDRLAATWWSWGAFDIDVNLKGSKAYRVAVYAIDWDSDTRVEKIEILDARTRQVLDVRQIAKFNNGVYVSWNATGHVIIRVSLLGGSNAVASAVFVD